MTKLLIAYDNYNSYRNAKLRFLNADITVLNSYTPFGIEEDNNLINVKIKPGKRLAKYGFIFATIGMFLSLWFQHWTFSNSYPLNIGGKPETNLAGFLPVTFECTILFAAMALGTMFLQYKHTTNRTHISELLSHDYFVLELETSQTFNRGFFEKTEPQQLKLIS